MRPMKLFPLHIILLATAPIALLISEQQASAFWSALSLGEMVQQADVVVRARVVEQERQKLPRRPDTDGEYGEEEVVVVTLAVEKTLFGQCDKTIRVSYDSDFLYATEYEEGVSYYLCLVRTQGEPCMYSEINANITPMPVRKGEVDIKKVVFHSRVRSLVCDKSPEEFERALRWLRGPVLAVKPLKAAFRCDEPLRFEATLSNTSSFPMKLPIAPGVTAFKALFDMDLWDKNGFSLSQRVECAAEAWRDANASGILAPGQKASTTVQVDIQLKHYVQDPSSAATATLRFISCLSDDARALDPRTRITDTPGPARPSLKDAWVGSVEADIPIALTCPYPAWAADLSRPDGEWQVSLENRGGSNGQFTNPDPRNWVVLAVRFALPQNGRRNVCFPWPTTLASRDERRLASCFVVERDGQKVPGPKRDEGNVRAWLNGLGREATDHCFEVNLSQYFAFDRPGTYRVRLHLPGAKAPSLSQVLHLVIPEDSLPTKEGQK